MFVSLDISCLPLFVNMPEKKCYWGLFCVIFIPVEIEHFPKSTLQQVILCFILSWITIQTKAWYSEFIMNKNYCYFLQKRYRAPTQSQLHKWTDCGLIEGEQVILKGKGVVEFVHLTLPLQGISLS